MYRLLQNSGMGHDIAYLVDNYSLSRCAMICTTECRTERHGWDTEGNEDDDNMGCRPVAEVITHVHKYEIRI